MGRIRGCGFLRILVRLDQKICSAGSESSPLTWARNSRKATAKTRKNEASDSTHDPYWFCPGYIKG